MFALPEALAPLANYAQFILYKLVWDAEKQGYKKIPIDPHTLQSYIKGDDWQSKPERWTTADIAIKTAKLCGDEYGVGFLFTVNDPFYFVDIDKCLLPDNATWSPVANSLMGMLQGAAVEVSQSGRGLHIIGSGTCPDHACKNIPLGLELYTERRFVALTGTNAIGNAAVDGSTMLPGLVNQYFVSKGMVKGQEWTNEPAPEWNGPSDDNELIEKMVASGSGASVFGGSVSFADLWTRNVPKLSERWDADESNANAEYDESSADQALIQHLAFWTGKNCERMFLLMWRSGLVRDKWTSNKNYLATSIKNGVAMQTDVYTGGSTEAVEDIIGDNHGAPNLKGTDGQKTWSANIRAQKLIECNGNEDLIVKLCASRGPVSTASFWIDNKDKTPDEILAIITPIDKAGDPLGKTDGPEYLTGYQFLGVEQQVELFAGCVYVQNLHRVFTPDGSFLRSEQFNATYGGYVFQLEADGTGKTSNKAWEAFTESRGVRYPKAQDTCFRPDLAPGALTKYEGRTVVNTYIPITTPRVQGDATPFLNHLAKLLPDEGDREILLSYMAACIQHIGVKFQWSPLIQGIEGNGKTLFTRCVEFAIGERYSHIPPADQISEKYNDWLFETLFIGVEDIYVPDHKREIIEILKPMITNNRHAIRQMQVSQIMKTICCNFIFNSNHKDAVRKTRTDRRFCIFYTAQQQFSDIERDGMDGNYFPDLYAWLKGAGKYESLGTGYGYAVVADYLASYAIPDALNPAKDSHRAPRTTSTDEAVKSSMGGVEQEIIEAIDEGRPGFAGGWVSSMALDKMLDNLRATRIIPPNKRREMLQALGYDWHPGLRDGRVNNMVMVDGGKPRLFIQDGHIHKNLTSAADIARHYQDAQTGAASTVHATNVFSKPQPPE